MILFLFFLIPPPPVVATQSFLLMKILVTRRKDFCFQKLGWMLENILERRCSALFFVTPWQMHTSCMYMSRFLTLPHI